MMTRTATLASATVLVLLLAGCSGGFIENRPVPPPTYKDLGFAGDAKGEDAAKWPDLNGTTITVLDNGAFSYGCPPAAERFEELTRAKVTCESGGDAGSAIGKLKADASAGTYDVLYGADNALLWKAQPYLEPFTPQNGKRLPSSVLFFDPQPGQAWPATPVDQGYVAINVDPSLTNITSLYRVRDNAADFVTQCPSQSSPGLAFMLITVAKFGEWDGAKTGTGPVYDWHDYWQDLFAKGVTVTKDWSDAYENHFTAGYGAGGGHATDKRIVTSYTESPAYEVSAKTFEPGEQATVLLEPKSTLRQIQTMGIVKGTTHLAAAQAFLEYALTDHFQGLAAPANAVYPVVPGIDVFDTYGGLDPAPGSFTTANSALPYDRIVDNLDRWQAEWSSLAPSSVQGVCGAVST